MTDTTSAGRPATLCGITWDHPRGYLPLEASSGSYEKEGNVRVRWERRSLKDFGDMPVNLLAGKYDLLVLDHPHIAAAVHDGCLLKLDDLMQPGELEMFAAQSAGPSYASYHYAGHQWALPVDAACQVAAYRPDLMEYRPPNVWDEVFSLAGEFSGKKKKMYIGTALCPTDCACIFLTLSAQYKEAPEEHTQGKRKEGLIRSETGQRILAHMLRLKNVSHPECIYWNPIDLYEHMAVHDDIAYSPLGFGYVNYATGNGRLRYAGIPGGSGALLGGAGIAISSRCKNPGAAAAYIAWICRPEYQKTKYLTGGGQPAQLDAWTDSQADEYTGGFFSGTLATLQQAYMRPRMVRWPEFQEYLGKAIHDFLTREKGADVTMEEVNRVYKDTFGDRHGNLK